MAKLIMHVTGLDGDIDLLTDRVVITRPGLWNAVKYGLHSKREIPLGAISEVVFKDAGAISFGEIDFVRSGRSMDEKMKRGSSVVKFTRKHQKEFVDLKEKVFELVDQYARQKHP